MESRAEVRNASDPRQVRRAEQRLKDRAQVLRAAYAELLRSPAGRLVLMDIIERKCGVFSPMWDPSARIHKNAGRVEVGLELLSNCKAIDLNATLAMLGETWDDNRRAGEENLASRTNQEGDDQ